MARLPRFLALALVLAACGDGRRDNGARIIVARDGGAFLDAGNIDPPRDGGGVVTRDGGPFVPGRDSGVHTPPRDGGVTPPRDGGGNGMRDAGPAQSLSIYDLQDVTSPRFPGEGAAVQVSNVVVSALVPAGGQAGSFYVQEATGGPYSGVFVFLPMGVPMPTIAVGDRVTITGTLEEYFGVTEIRFSALLTRTPGAAPLPVIVTASSIATGGLQSEAYEGVLVEVQSVTVVSDNPDAPMDFGEFAVSGGLRVDDALYRVEPRPFVGSQISYVRGVLHYAFENFKLYPRDPSDIGSIF